MAARAEVDFIGTDVSLGKELNRLNSRLEGWSRNTRRLVTGALAVFSSREIIDFVGRSITAFEEQADAEVKLNAVLKATGEAAHFTSNELKDMAANLQKVTKFGDETTIAAQSVLLTFKNVKKEGDIFEDAIRSAMDMTTLLGGDLKSNALRLGKALNEPIKGVGRLSEAGVSFTETQKDMIKALVETGDTMSAQRIILNELAGEFGGVATAAAETWRGKLIQIQNLMGDKMEEIGGIFSNALMDNLNTGVRVFTALETMVMNFSKTYELAYTSIALAGATTWNSLGHFLTKVIPAWIAFLLDNWKDIFTTIRDFTISVLENMLKNFRDFLDAVNGWLHGDGYDFEFTGLTDGFESSIKELPFILERELGPIEAILKERVDALNAELSIDFDERLQKNRDNLGLDNEEGPRTKRLPSASPAVIVTNALSSFLDEGFKSLNDLVLGAKFGGKEGESGSNGLEGLTALFDRIQGAAASNRGLKAQEDTAISSAKTAALSAKISDAAEETTLNLGVMIGQLSNGIAGTFSK